MMFRTTMLTLALCALAGAAAAQTAQTQPAAPQSSPGAAKTSPMTSSPSPMAPTARMPSRTDSADEAYRALDASNRGFLTKGDVQGLAGFNFEQADINHDGRLSKDEFARAWGSQK